jgi:hypothetical protein
LIPSLIRTIRCSILLLRFITLLVAVLIVSAPAIASSRQWTPAIPLSEPLLEPRPAGVSGVAWDGESYLAVFVIDRQVVARRIDAQGQLVDTIPFPVTTPASMSQSARVVAVGGRFLVIRQIDYRQHAARFVYRDGRMSPEFQLHDGFASRFHVATDGRDVLVIADSSAFLLKNAAATDSPSISPVEMPDGGYQVTDIASSGSGFLIAAREHAPSGATLLLRIAPSSGTAELTERLPQVWAPQLAARRSGYALFSGGKPLTVQSISLEGKVEGEPLHISDAVVFYAQVSTSTDSDTVHLVWRAPDSGTTAPTPVMYTRIDGQSIAPSRPLGISAHSVTLAGPSSSPLLFWNDSESLRHAFLSLPDGELHSTRPTWLAPAEQRDAHVTATPAGWFTVWSESRLPQQSRIRAATIDASLARSAPFDVGGDAQMETAPFAAGNGRVVLVVWRQDHTRLVGRRYTPQGEPLDKGAFVIEPAFGDPGAPVWNGRYFLVPYFTAMGVVHVARISEEGLLVGVTVVTRVNRESIEPPHIAVADETALLVWQVGGVFLSCTVTCPVLTTPQIDGVRLSIEAQVIDPAPVQFSPLGAFAPAIAAVGDRFLISWRTSGVHYRLVNASDLEGEAAVHVAGSRPSESPRVAAVSRQADFVLFWNEGGAWTDQARIEAAFIGHDGELRGRGTVVTTIPEHQSGFSAAARGDDLLLLDWNRRRELVSTFRVFYRGFLQPVSRRRGVVPQASPASGSSLAPAAASGAAARTSINTFESRGSLNHAALPEQGISIAHEFDNE